MCIDTQIKRVFFPTVKVLRFNRKKPLPDAEDIDYVNSYINHGVSGSVSVTGYRSVIKVENDIQKTTHVILFIVFDARLGPEICLFQSQTKHLSTEVWKNG